MTFGDTPTRSTTGSLAVLAPLTAVLAAATYSSFLLTGLTHPPGGGAGFISELELPGQPWSWLYRACDAISGIAIVGTALLTVRRLNRRRLGLLACSLLAMAGVASATDALTTMACTRTPAGACADNAVSPGAMVAAAASAHTVSGVIGLLGIVAGLILLGETLRKDSPRWAALFIVLGVLVSVSALLDIVLLLRSMDVGGCERARALITSAALTALAGWHRGAPSNSPTAASRSPHGPLRTTHPAAEAPN